jgi:hypothetical protein
VLPTKRRLLSLEFLFQNLAGERRVGLAFGETEFPGF